MQQQLRKTKIVCTIGPATDRDEVLRQMMQAGMNVARFNFSHADYEKDKKRFEQVVRLREELGLPIATMLDTKGPEVRLRTFPNGSVEIDDGAM
jgi:pyruvate kinase